MRSMSERTMRAANGGKKKKYVFYKCANCGWVIEHVGWACIVHDLFMGHSTPAWYDYTVWL